MSVKIMEEIFTIKYSFFVELNQLKVGHTEIFPINGACEFNLTVFLKHFDKNKYLSTVTKNIFRRFE